MSGPLCPGTCGVPTYLPGQHQIADAYRELLEPTDYASIERGQAALTCPSLREIVHLSQWLVRRGRRRFGLRGRLLVKSQMGPSSDSWKADAIRTTPNLEQLLR